MMSQIKGEVTSLSDVLAAAARHRATAQNDEEEALLGHVRGDCHNGALCALCRAERRAFEAEQTVSNIISGVSYATPQAEPCEVCDPVVDCRRGCTARL